MSKVMSLTGGKQYGSSMHSGQGEWPTNGEASEEPKASRSVSALIAQQGASLGSCPSKPNLDAKAPAPKTRADAGSADAC